MIFYFTGALLMSLALIKLGTYAAIIAMIQASTKVAVGLLAVVVLALLYRKLRGITRSTKPLQLPNS